MDDLPPHQIPPLLPPDAHRPPIAPPPIISAPPPAPRAGGCSVVWKILAIIFIILFCFSFLRNMMGFARGVMSRGHTTERAHTLEEATIESTNTDDKIAVVEVDGIISSREVEQSGMNLVEYVTAQLHEAERDSDVKAVILKVNSPGGEVLASDEINSAIRKFEDDSHKPVIVSMGSLAASGGYYISAPCRWIVANELTITGSIGVIMEGYNYRALMDKIGIRPQVYKSGAFKDMLSGEREPDTNKLSTADLKIRQEEDTIVQSYINDTYMRFRHVVQSGRNAAAKENAGQGQALAADWTDYADGRILNGKDALKLGFVDELGDFQTARKRAEKLAGVSKASLVEYRMQFDLGSVLSHVFGKSSTPALKVDLGINAPVLEAGRPYYILPTAVWH